MNRGDEIKNYILRHLVLSTRNPVMPVAREFKIAVKTAQSYVDRMCKEGLLVASTKGGAKRYELGLTGESHQRYTAEGLRYQTVWAENGEQLLKDLQPNERSICEHGLKELVNNALNHSESQEISVLVRVSPVSVLISVLDYGVGLFSKASDVFGLSDQRLAILRIGERQPCEGLLMCSNLFDKFIINSGELNFVRSAGEPGWLTHEFDNPMLGTSVTLVLFLPASRQLRSTLESCRNQPDVHNFAQTVVSIPLSNRGNKLTTTQDAHDLLDSVQEFRQIVLNFKGVQSIGADFARAIFVDYKRQHPESSVRWIRASDQVAQTIIGNLAPTA